MRSYRLIPFLTLGAFVFLGSNCPDHDLGDTSDTAAGDADTDTDSDADTDTDADTDPPQGFNATIQGTVQVILYTLDIDGEYVYISWNEAYSDVFIFGNNFVTAYNTDGKTGDEVYYDEYVIDSPSTTGDPYELQVDTESESVRVYAANDYWGDRIIGTGDPIGNYPDVITDPDPEDPDNTIVGVDITILIPYWDGSGGGGCGGDGGGNGDGTSTIEGDIIITTSYAGGDAAAMLLDTDNEGPYYSTWVTPEPSGGGAEAAYVLDTCSSYGHMNLVGVWDSNFNGLGDPLDKWGTYISETDVDGNPIDVTAGLEDADIQIPFGFDGLELTPFVRVYGELSYNEGSTFDDLPAGTQVYVAALKYHPDTDIYTSDLQNAYDYEVFSSDDLAGVTTIDYELVVPANGIIYLWAYADMDNDGLLNEDGEAVGTGSDDENGRLPTGSQAQNINIDLRIVESGE